MTSEPSRKEELAFAEACDPLTSWPQEPRNGPGYHNNYLFTLTPAESREAFDPPPLETLLLDL